ncbi:DUF4189 domain-containing protein [Rhodovarius crocodyli]|uniref:DUF4189 domain-containing protein n=1 Tax=Rhodovarius crocodyli TaxID=1979269 RepID=A0A437M2Y1_9PROT|nr:DUF4189 domain-containing protein [Rhodovarius crocodyli]RVT92048.1 DUF4189 domain-containing protein [Rhodovarius crocodyli]
MRSIGQLALAIGLAIITAGAAQAQGNPPAACFQQCAAPARSLQANPPPVQACLIRCRAASEFSAQQNQRPLRGPVTRAASNPYSSGRGIPVAASALPATAGQWGAIYAALPPTAAVGIVAGPRDRNIAHTQAESQCRTTARGDCRLLTEFSSGCGSAAQAVRSMSIVPSNHPSTYRVTYVASGTGPSRSDAERAAVASCNSRDPQATCRVVSTACIGGG